MPHAVLCLLPLAAALCTAGCTSMSEHSRVISQWAADDANLLRREFDLARQELLEALVVNATRQPAPATGVAK